MAITKKGWVQGLMLFIITVFSTSCGILAQAPDSENAPLAETLSKNKKETLLREDIVEFAQQYVGTRYRSAGKSPSGFDCSGFVYHVMKEFEIKMASSSSTQENQGNAIEAKEAKPGDLVFFRRSKGGRVFHVAMVLENKKGNLTLIHSTSSRGVVIDSLKESSYWRSKHMTVRNVVSGK
jgi:cell wall-associated NlpC family hydrolase